MYQLNHSAIEKYKQSLAIAQKAAFKQSFQPEELVVPVAGSFVIESQEYQNTISLNQTILIQQSDDWALRLNSSEYIIGGVASYCVTPILTLRILAKTYATFSASSANIPKIQASIVTPLGYGYPYLYLGANLKVETLKLKDNVNTNTFWLGSKSACVELKLDKQTTLSFSKKFKQNSLQQFVKLRVRAFRPEFYLGVQYKDEMLKLQSRIYCTQESMRLENNFILKLNENWKAVLQTVVKRDRVFVNLGFQNNSFYFQIPLFMQITQTLLDKIVLLGTLVMVFGVIFKMKRDSQKNSNNQSGKLEQRLSQQKQVINLMQQKIQASYENETQSRGLIIIEAYYGKEQHITDLMRQEDKSRYHLENNLEIVDVTLPLIFWVKNSQLQLFKQSKSKLLGFCNPCLSEDESKLLFIRYKYRDQVKERIFKDLGSILIP